MNDVVDIAILFGGDAIVRVTNQTSILAQSEAIDEPITVEIRLLQVVAQFNLPG